MSTVKGGGGVRAERSGRTMRGAMGTGRYRQTGEHNGDGFEGCVGGWGGRGGQWVWVWKLRQGWGRGGGGGGGVKTEVKTVG